VKNIPKKENEIAQRIRARRERLREQAKVFHRDFNKQLLVFLTGAFSFMAALVWNTAIQEIITNYKTEIFYYLPLKESYYVDILFAFVVTVIAVVAIIIISRILKTD